MSRPNKALQQLIEHSEKSKVLPKHLIHNFFQKIIIKNYLIIKKGSNDILTTGFGVPVGDRINSITAGRNGPLLMQDAVYLDEMAHFDHERVPERVVHAKGAGAFGYFEVTHDITKYTKMVVFEQIGKKTPVVRLNSTILLLIIKIEQKLQKSFVS